MKRNNNFHHHTTAQSLGIDTHKATNSSVSAEEHGPALYHGLHPPPRPTAGPLTQTHRPLSPRCTAGVVHRYLRRLHLSCSLAVCSTWEKSNVQCKGKKLHKCSTVSPYKMIAYGEQGKWLGVGLVTSIHIQRKHATPSKRKYIAYRHHQKWRYRHEWLHVDYAHNGLRLSQGKTHQNTWWVATAWNSRRRIPLTSGLLQWLADYCIKLTNCIFDVHVRTPDTLPNLRVLSAERIPRLRP